MGRTLPPAAAPIAPAQLAAGLRGWLRGEKELERFRQELREAFGVKHCFLLSSGQAALALVLQALKAMHPQRRTVVIPAFTCYSVPAAIVRAGLDIRLCDLAADRLDFDPGRLSQILAEPDRRNDILAVVPTHLYGMPADVARVRHLLAGFPVATIEDAAQAMGGEAEGRKLGTLGDVGFFSLGRGKAFSTVEGGVILTDRDDIAAELGRLVGRLPGYGILQRLKLAAMAAALMLLMHPRVFWLPSSLPFLRLGETVYDPDFGMHRMSAFQAGLTRNWQARLRRLSEGRKAQVRRWTGFLGKRSPDNGEGQVGLIRLPVAIRGPGNRQALLARSAQAGLGIRAVYPTSVDSIPQLRGAFGAEKYPAAHGYAATLVTLPTHDYVREKDMERTVAMLAGIER